MQTIRVNLKNRSYDIVIGSGIIKSLGRYIKKLDIGHDAYIITNNTIKNKFGAILEKSLKQSDISVKFRIVPDTEKSKSIEIASSVVKDLSRHDRRRKIFIIAFGGGVIGDLAGFVASIYRRGIPYIQIPTTLLAQVDSSIGGKTAVDLFEAKNMVGAFYQPKLVVSDVNFLASLDKRQIRAGLAEVIKYGAIDDPQLFLFLEKNLNKVLNLNKKALEYIVKRCSKIKAAVVTKDEKEEKGLRTVLNFGHTMGHAIEAASGYKSYNHGEAVAIGMLIAAQISMILGLIPEKVGLRLEKLIRRTGLPDKIARIPQGSIINAHFRDKKFKGSHNRFVLLRGIGRTKIVENIPLTVIKLSLNKYCSVGKK